MSSIESDDTRLRALIDARCVRRGATGVGHYVAGLLQGLAEVSDEAGIEPVALILSGEGDTFRQLVRSDRPIRTLEVATDYTRHPAAEWFLHVGLDRLIRNQRAQVLVSPFFLAPAGPRPYARVLGVLDDLTWRFPEGYSVGFRWLVAAHLGGSLRFCESLFTLSRHMSDAVAAHWGLDLRPRLRAIEGAVDLQVFHPQRNAVDPEIDRLRAEAGNPDRLLVYTASGEPRKNHRVVLEALAGFGAGDPRTVLAAVGLTPQDVSRLRLPTRDAAGRPILHAVRPDSRAGVAAWVRSADLVVFPSLGEGFGLPILEAMASNQRVLASDAPELASLLPPLWPTVDRRDPAAWRAALREVLANPHLDIDESSDCFKWVSRWSWERSGSVLARAIREAHELRVGLRTR